MADLSLDDFIRKNNVKVQVRKNQGRGESQHKNPNINVKFANVSQSFDARSKLGPKKPVVDVRVKIGPSLDNKKSDARNKIVQKQVQKGTFDARSLLRKKINNAPNNPTGPPMPANVIQPITRTLSNPSYMEQADVQVFKQIPNTQVSISGNSLQVTKRGMGGKPASLSSMGEAVPIIQIRNDRYQQRQEIQQAPPVPTWSSQGSHRAPQPAHLEIQRPQHTTPFAPVQRQHPSQHYPFQDMNNSVPNTASIKSIEAAGMRPVSNRPGPQESRAPQPRVSQHRAPQPRAPQPRGPQSRGPQVRAPPGAATLSAKQPISLTQTAGLKRSLPSQEPGGPLRLGKGGGPGIHVGIGEVSPPKKLKAGMLASNPIEIDVEDNSKYVSPLQGFRVVVTNLFSRVTQDDIIELFGVVGPLKKARLLKAGSAEVVYSAREDALKAVQKYHGRELDGQPMYVKMTTPSTAVVKASGGLDPDITGEALRLYKKPSSLGALPEAPIEVPTIHRALFKVGPPAPNKSVKFTVKI